ncbi:MAG TPA: amino acid ABC transporter [Gammaproteobacteria bacterium]|nr:amino acid ABC transporter [Gammaproteobacteria bacterium]
MHGLFIRQRGAGWSPLALLLLILGLVGCEQSEQATIRTVADAESARLGVVTGSTPAEIAYLRFPDAEVQEFGDFSDTLGALQAGHVDAILTSINAAILAARNNPEFVVIEESLRDETTAIAMRKGDDELRAQVNQVLADLKADGTLADMSRRWFKRTPGPYEEIDVAVPSAGPMLRIGVSATREPFSFIDQAGRISGHDGDLARLLGARLERPIEFTDVRFDALIPALQSGKVDLLVTGMSATDERRKFVDFSDTYYQNKIVLLARTEGAEEAAPTTGLELRTAQDVAELTVGVLQGSAHDTWAQANFPKAELPQFVSYADLLAAVEAGKVDAGLSDTESLMIAIQDRPDLVPLGDSIFASDVGAGFRTDSADLRAEFDEFLASIKKDGTHADMEARWYKRNETRLPAIEFDEDAPPLRVGNAIVGLPSAAIIDNEISGYEIELAMRFAHATGRRPEYVTVDWGALIPSLVSGKIDLIIAGMYITPERAERIDFSAPYHRSENNVFVLKRNLAGAAAAAEGTPEPSFFDEVAESFHSNIIREDRYLLLWDGLVITVWLSILSSIFGTALGALVCYMRMSPNLILRQLAKTYISLLRGTPVLVLLMLIFYVVFASIAIDPVLVAVFAFGLNFAAYVSEMFRTGIESIDRGQTEAGVAMGFSRIGTFRHIVLPQALQRILPVYKGEFISMVKMTSIVGYVAVQDLTKASDIIRSRTFDAFFPLIVVAVMYFLISWVLIQALEYLERRTDPMTRRRRGTPA